MISYDIMQCSVLLLKMTQKLQLVQKAAARMLLDKPRSHNATPLLEELHWLLVSFWIQCKVLVITHKALNGLVSGYLKDHLSIKISAQPLQSVPGARPGGGGGLRISPIKEARMMGT